MRKRSLLITLTMATALCSQAAFCSDEALKPGIAEYNKGHYAEAAGLFGASLNTDFNNAALHYYLGNCFSHMKQKEAAVREFRIAFALEPDKEAGKFSKQALATYGLDPTGTVEPKKGGIDALMPNGALPPPGATATSMAPLVAPQPSKSTELDRQASDLKNLRESEGKLSSQQAEKQGTAMAEQLKRDLLDSMRYVTRRGYVISPSLTNDNKTYIEGVKQSYNAQRDAYLQNSSRQSSEIQRTADALRDQMNEQTKAGKVHLSPTGTNLYVRSYEMTPAADAKAPLKQSSTPASSTTAPSSSSSSSGQSHSK
ncbi:MAG TPA: hypothetical protein V6C76_17730 [Drouetiella sp.]